LPTELKYQADKLAEYSTTGKQQLGKFGRRREAAVTTRFMD